MSGKAEDDTDRELAASWHDLMGRYHRISCALDRELAGQHGITVSDFEILQQLHEAGTPDGLRMHDLGDRVHLTQSALSRLISRLEADGLVQRCMCTEDRRSVITVITPAGSERFLAARPTQRAILRDEVARSS
jgi:DNA-binding MarR family transcriptional regulator